jgi:hypothetical protein
VRLLPRLGRARLGRQVARRLRRAGLADVHFDRRAFQVNFLLGDGDRSVIELAPLQATRPRKGRIDRFVAGLLLAPGLPQEWTAVKPLLRPVLRGVTPGDTLRRPVLPFLGEFIVVDQPDTMTYVSPEQLAAWGVTADMVYEAAHANLSGAVLQGSARGPTVVRFVDDGDAYWTSHLLLPHWLGRLSDQVGGRPVAFAPERGTLLVTAAESDHLPALFAQAEEIFTRSSRPITPMAYVSDPDGCTVAFAVPAGDPLAPAVGRAERLLAVSEYARQAAHLPDEPLAALTLHEGRTRTHWPTGKHDTLLPKADEVEIDGSVCPWSEVLHRLSQVRDFNPPRWRIKPTHRITT